MESLLNVLKLSAEYFRQKGITDPRRQAEEMLCDLLGMERLELYMDFERSLSEEEMAECRKRLKRRAAGEPLQYICGEVEFYGCSIHVDQAVLIPRQETEILVDKIVQTLSRYELKDKILWDVCCGSGCIGIALKKRFPELNVTLSDVSSKALQVASDNAKHNQVNVRLLEGDLLQPFGAEKAHFIVCNPPYISELEFETLDKEVGCYEPRLALVGGKKGTEIYELLAQDLSNFLYSGGLAWFEIGHQQGKELTVLFEDKCWKIRCLEQDWAGHDRFFFLENE